METDKQQNKDELYKMEQVALSFQKAIKGLGTDEDRVIKELVDYNNKQRQLIRTKYLLLTGKDLLDDLKSDLNGYFLETVLALFTPLDEYEAKILNNAIKGIGTNEKKIIQILCTKDAKEIRDLKLAYKKIIKKELDEDLKHEESGDLGRIFRSLATGARNENHGYDLEFILKEAKNLYDAGQGKLGTDEKEFIRIFCSRSFPELYAIFAVYEEKFKKNIEQVIKGEFSGDLREALLAITKCVRHKPSFFAELIYLSMVNAGTNEHELLEVIVRRSDIDLKAIKSEYNRLYGHKLENVVEKEISGDFKKLILALINKN